MSDPTRTTVTLWLTDSVRLAVHPTTDILHIQGPWGHADVVVYPDSPEVLRQLALACAQLADDMERRAKVKP